MKTIYLIRHAKSSWKEPNQLDHERPLNKRGKRDFPLIAKQLNKINITPELIVCSNSQRTKDTVKLLCKEINYPIKDVKYDSTIYEASLVSLIEVVNTLPRNYNEIVIIGHNPSITLLSNYLTNDNIDHMPTSGVVKIDLEVEDWNEVIQGIGLKKFFIYPKML